MAFNPSPKVAMARDFAKKFDKNMVIIFSFNEDTLEYASYGETKNLCKKAEILANEAYENILNNW